MPDNKDEIELVKELLDAGAISDLREMVQVWRSIKSLGYLGNIIIRIGALVGGLYSIWYAVTNYLSIGIKQ